MLIANQNLTEEQINNVAAYNLRGVSIALNEVRNLAQKTKSDLLKNKIFTSLTRNKEEIDAILEELGVLDVDRK